MTIGKPWHTDRCVLSILLKDGFLSQRHCSYQAEVIQTAEILTEPEKGSVMNIFVVHVPVVH